MANKKAETGGSVRLGHIRRTGLGGKERLNVGLGGDEGEGAILSVHEELSAERLPQHVLGRLVVDRTLWRAAAVTRDATAICSARRNPECVGQGIRDGGVSR